MRYRRNPATTFVLLGLGAVALYVLTRKKTVGSATVPVTGTAVPPVSGSICEAGYMHRASDNMCVPVGSGPQQSTNQFTTSSSAPCVSWVDSAGNFHDNNC